MKEILNELKESGVHNIVSYKQIILEISEENLKQTDQIDFLISSLLTKTANCKFKKVLLECPRVYLDRLNCTMKKMNIKGERIIYKKSLRNPINIADLDYELWSFSEEKSVLFLSEVIGRNMEETENFLMSLKTELPSHINRMFTVYIVKNQPIGVVLPHLEPDRDKEVRIFWIGIHPEFRGERLGKNLHLLGLYRLQNDFNVKSYLGATQTDNNPMRKILISNGCVENNNTVISLEFSSK